MHAESEVAEAELPNLEQALRAQLDRVVRELLAAARDQRRPSTSFSEFGVEQLIGRLRSLYPEPSLARSEPLQIDALTIDLTAHEVRLSGREVHLTRREFGVLKLLLEQRDRALTREEILDRVWGRSEVHSRRTVDIHVHRLRSKLGTSFTDRLQTLRNVGYKLRYEPLPPDVH